MSCPRFGRTSLHWAALNGHAKMTKLLLDGRDAKTKITDDELSPLMAVHCSCLRVQQVLAMLAVIV